MPVVDFSEWTGGTLEPAPDLTAMDALEAEVVPLGALSPWTLLVPAPDRPPECWETPVTWLASVNASLTLGEGPPQQVVLGFRVPDGDPAAMTASVSMADVVGVPELAEPLQAWWDARHQGELVQAGGSIYMNATGGTWTTIAEFLGPEVASATVFEGELLR